jgi:hypothetical protein
VSDEVRRRELAGVVDAAQRAAGVLVARHRGDVSGSQELLATFADDRELAGGALLLAELTMSLYSDETGRDFADCLQDLNLQMESAVGR